MKLLVKVIEAKYSATPQVAIAEITPEFLGSVQQLMNKTPVAFKMNHPPEYFYVDRRDLLSLLKATEGRVTDWDEFTHLSIEAEFWSCKWEQIEVADHILIIDNSGIYFKAVDSEDFVYLTAPLTAADLSVEEEQAYLLKAVAAT